MDVTKKIRSTQTPAVTQSRGALKSKGPYLFPQMPNLAKISSLNPDLNTTRQYHCQNAPATRRTTQPRGEELLNAASGNTLAGLAEGQGCASEARADPNRTLRRSLWRTHRELRLTTH